MGIPGIRQAIAVRTIRRRGVQTTTVSIDHVIPDSAGPPRARWRVTSGPARLPGSEFESAAEVNARFTEGRAIACVDIASNATVAAIAYHIDHRKTNPVLLTDVAIRPDASWREIGHGAVPILKAYLHELSVKLGRDGAVGFFPPTARVAEGYIDRYGFTRAAVPSPWRRYGSIYLKQLPFE